MAKKETPKSATERPKPTPLANKPVPHAYALMQDPHRPGKYFAVHLSNVIAEDIEYLEASARAENVAYGLRRLSAAMEERHRRRAWASEEKARKERPSLTKKDDSQSTEPAKEPATELEAEASS